jgi:hypothetical protein
MISAAVSLRILRMRDQYLFSACLMIGLACASAVPAQAQASGSVESPVILTETLPKAVLRHSYEQKLESKGGVQPLSWAISTGQLPPGVTLPSDSGAIAGSPTAKGEFHFTVQVTDSAKPPRSHAREFVLRVVPPLQIEWKTQPSTDAQGIAGAVEVTNHTGDDFDLTFIAVAVNQIGKAFVLGYEHFSLTAGTEQRQISFGSNLSRGQYIVHADAVAEIPDKLIIYRSRLQTSAALPMQ